MKQVTIVPAILVDSFKLFKEQVKKAEKNFKIAQIDIIDGEFVENKSFYNLDKIKSVKTPLIYEIHLMVEDPNSFVAKWKKYTKVRRIIFHYESVPEDQIKPLITEIKRAKKQAGIAINPETHVRKIMPWLNKLDLVLVMGVHPGWSGQKFEPIAYHKLRTLRKLAPKINLGIDGGVDAVRAQNLIDAGANIICSGSYLFKAKDIKQAKQALLAK